MSSVRPSMFIGSSVEGRRIAEALQLNLEYDLDCTVWHQGVFALSRGTLDSLVEIASAFDFATLVLTPDDVVRKRGRQRRAGRDNVVFELGLFMGSLGPDRTFLVYCRDHPIDLPTDLAGVTAATFAERDDITAALGPVATQIKRHVDRLRLRSMGPPRLPPTGSSSPLGPLRGGRGSRRRGQGRGRGPVRNARGRSPPRR
jgi:predicted nucleotide-binding protein